MRGTRVEELLAFDLALGCGKIPEIDEAARPADAPYPLSSAWGDATRARLIGFDEAGRGALAGPIVVGCVHISPELLADHEAVLRLLPGVDDSKALSPKARDAAFACVVACARWAFGCASAAEIDAVGIVPAAERAARRAYRRLGVSCDLMVFDRGLSLGQPVVLDPGCTASSAIQLGGSRAACEPQCDGHPARGTRQEGEPDREEFGSRLSQPNSQATRPQGSPSRRPPGSLRLPGVAFTRGDTRSLHVAAASLVAKVTRDRIMQRLDRSFPGFDLGKHKGYGTPGHLRALTERVPSPIHRRTFLRGLEEARSQSC